MKRVIAVGQRSGRRMVHALTACRKRVEGYWDKEYWQVKTLCQDHELRGRGVPTPDLPVDCPECLERWRMAADGTWSEVGA